MNVIATEIPGVLVVEPRVFGDHRGFFMESWNERAFAQAGIAARFVQDNLSRSSRGVLRGLHLQNPHGQAKLVSVLEGEVYDVAVDVRVGSPTFGRWVAAVLSGENKRHFYIPPGFAHGFCVLSDSALFFYKCTYFYHPECEVTVAWNDPNIGIPWPVSGPTVSAKDAVAMRLNAIARERLPKYEG